MSKTVTYRLPPYVELDYNPHYTGGDTEYVPIKLQSIGDYPMGTYTVQAPAPFGGQYSAVSSTNDSVTLLYPVPPGRYPAKTTDDFMDVNTYGFAYKEYDFKITSALGISGEAAFDPYIFDFDAFEGQDSVRFNQIEIVTDVLYSTTHPQGYAVIYLPDLPGFDQDNIQDPSGVGLMTASSLSKTLGMYLIIIAGTQGSSDFDYTIYPDLPNDRNAEVLATSLNDATGAKITITYDSLYLADTGPGVSAVYPFRKDLPSTTQPVLITLPQGSRTSAFRFYRGDRAMDFDLYGGADVAPQGDLIQNAIPANLIEIKKL